MLARVLTGAAVGLDCSLVEVEVDLAQGLPNFTVVGLPDAAEQEARERVRAAVRNSGYPFPNRRQYRCCVEHPGRGGHPSAKCFHRGVAGCPRVILSAAKDRFPYAGRHGWFAALTMTCCSLSVEAFS